MASVTFFDRSPAMLRMARNKFSKGVFVRGEAERLPFLDAEFDIVVSRGALISQLDPVMVPQVLSQVWRSLRPQGCFLFDFVCDPRSWFGPPHLYVGGWSRPGMEAFLRIHLPGAQILAYDGTDRHGLNRILIKKT
jgi:ubiquinone/menaquinone biosynthesis C-methylase UbiE